MIERNYRWVVVLVGGVLGYVAIGTMFSLPVFLSPMSQATGWSHTGISTAMTLGFLAMAVASVLWGMLADRIGPRRVVLAGSAGLAVGLALASRAASLLEFQLLFGLIVGGSVAAIFAPIMAAVTGWFDTHRSLAVSLVSAGFGMAPLTMSPFAAWLISSYHWRTALLLIAAVAPIVMLPLALLVRSAPASIAARSVVAPSGTDSEPLSVGWALRSPQFAILAFTNFLCCATHSGPIFHTVSYAVTCGISAMVAVSIYSLEGLAGMGGRLMFGLLGDRLGAKRVLVAGLLVQAFGALGYAFVRDLDGFYAVAALFGFTYAGVMPLYAVIARENFPLRMMGTIIGGTTMASSLGMSVGPLIGGWIFDTYAAYTWLYIASFAIGLGAALIAITFRPFSEPIGNRIRAGQVTG